MPSLVKFAAKIAVGGVLLHLAVAVIMAALMSRSYRQRMPNLRLLDSEPGAKASFIASYLHDVVDDGRPVTCFVGSSFLWGYPLVEQAAPPAAAGRLLADSKTINASIIGAGLDAATNTLEIARESGVRFTRVVVEIPIVNELCFQEMVYARTALLHPAGPRSSVRAGPYAKTYREYFLTTPGGWYIRPPLITEDEVGDDRPVQLAKLPEDYFLTRERFAAVCRSYERNITATLEAARAVADEVVVFPSPIYMAGAEALGFDRKALEEQVAFTLEACRRVKGVAVVELEPRHVANAGLFANVTHFNRRGNREFGEWLARRIAAGDRGNTVASDGGTMRR